MATYAERAEMIVTGIIDGVPTPEQIQRIGDAFADLNFPEQGTGITIAQAVYAQRPLIDGEPDTSPLTGAEKAEIFVRTFRSWGQGIIRHYAERQESLNYTDEIATAGDTAVGDL